MTAKDLKAIRKTLGYSQTKMADVMGYKSRISIQRKESGSEKISAQDRKLLKILCLLHDIAVN